MPMTLLQACRAGTCRRSGPKTMDPQLHDACIVEATWEATPSKPRGVPLIRYIHAAPALCEAACERYSHPCWASHRIRVYAEREAIELPDYKNVCDDIYDRRLRFVQDMVRSTGRPYYLEEERWWRPIVPNDDDEPLPCEEY